MALITQQKILKNVRASKTALTVTEIANLSKSRYRPIKNEILNLEALGILRIVRTLSGRLIILGVNEIEPNT